MGPELLHVGRDGVHALGVVDHHARVEHAVVAEHPLEDVGERQEREALVLGGEAEQPDTGRHVRGDVAVGQHHALRVAGGARGVDEGGEVVGGRLQRRRPASRGAMPVAARPRASTSSKAMTPGPAADSSNAITCASAGRLAAHRQHLVQLGRGRDQYRDGAGVAQDVLGLLAGKGGVDRDVGAAGGETGVVGDGPLGPVLREDRHPIAGRTSQLQQAEAQVLDPLRHLAIAEVHPASRALGFGGPPAGFRTGPSPRSRADSGCAAWWPPTGTGR